jgi:regulator of replication initiation timing
MGIWDDGKEIIKIVDTVRELKEQLKELGAEVADLKTRVAVLESREDAIILSAKESVRQLLAGNVGQLPGSED